MTPTGSDLQRASEGLSGRGGWDALAAASIAFVISVVGAQRPGFQGDEFATLAASTRSLPQLWKMLGDVDIYNGLYYIVMQAWFSVLPANEFTARLPSSLAIAVAAAGVVVLGRQTSTRRVAVTSGLLFAVLPRVTWAATEARVGAMTMAVAVWLTVLCIAAARRDRPGLWFPYSVAMVGAGVLNAMLLLMVPVHAVAVWTFAGTPRAFRHWAAAAAVTVAGTTPFFLLAMPQASRWVPKRVLGNAHSIALRVLDQQYFDHGLVSYPVAVVTGAVLIAGLLVYRRSGARDLDGLLVLAAAWVVIPTVSLLAISLVRPIYLERYLSFTAPGFALLVGAGATFVGKSRLGITAVLTLIAIAAAPVYLAQRQADAKMWKAKGNELGTDYHPVAEVLDSRASAGDCLQIDTPDPGRPWLTLRRLTLPRPGTYERLRDPGRFGAAEGSTIMVATSLPVSRWADRLGTCPALWTISLRDNTLPDHQEGTALPPGPLLQGREAYTVPNRLGFHIVERWQTDYTQVTKSVPAGVG